MNFTENYKKNGVTKMWLQINGFKYSKEFSDSESEIYVKRFPLTKYSGATILEGELLLDKRSGSVIVNVKSAKTNTLYPTYYNYYGNHNSILFKQIDEKISNELSRLGIKKIERKKNELIRIKRKTRNNN